MVKRVIFGDIHGHYDSFYELYKKEDPDEVILLGDYVDSFTQTSQQCKECLVNLLDLRQEHIKNKGNFIMLLGNHDFHYIVGGERYSGFKTNTLSLCGEILTKAVITDKSIIPIYVDSVNNIIFSHAGITNTWMTLHQLQLEDVNKIESFFDLSKFRFTGFNCYGDHPSNGPIWVRPRSLFSDMYGDYRQIVGHTHTQSPITELNLTVIDTMPNYYIVQELDDDRKLVNETIVNNTK